VFCPVADQKSEEVRAIKLAFVAIVALMCSPVCAQPADSYDVLFIVVDDLND
jgi:hypothetical protein